jgi:hypothetical protein
MRRKILPFILGGALSIAAVAPAAATGHNGGNGDTTCIVEPQSNKGGAAGLAALIAAAVNVQANVGANVCDVNINILNRSLNNLLRNADIDVLNNVLNNSLNNILRNADIRVIRDVQVLNDSQIQVNLLSGPSFIVNLIDG